MKTISISDFTTTLLVDQTPKEVFKSINRISDWWTKSFEGHSEKLHDVFTVHFGETYITIKIVELNPYKKILWHVIDCNKHWLKDQKEWKDTKISWEISAGKNNSQIRFTHIGLVPGIECYKVCEKAWNFYLNESLFNLLKKGKGIPELK